MKVRDIMREPAATVSPGATVAEALACMKDLGVGWLPVEEEDETFLGIVTAADLSRRSVEPTGGPSAPIKHCLAADPVTATPEMDVGRLAEMMRDKDRDHAMVLDGVYLVGTVSLAEATTAQHGEGPLEEQGRAA